MLLNQSVKQDRGQRTEDRETVQTERDKSLLDFQWLIFDYGDDEDISGHSSSSPGCISGGKTLHN